MAKKKSKKPLSMGELFEKKVKQLNKRAADNMARFRAEQKRQGKKPDEPIDLMKMVWG